MSFFDHLLGSDGCNLDGTVGNNPFTSMIDTVFNHQYSYDQSQSQYYQSQSETQQPIFIDNDSSNMDIIHQDQMTNNQQYQQSNMMMINPFQMPQENLRIPSYMHSMHTMPPPMMMFPPLNSMMFPFPSQSMMPQYHPNQDYYQQQSYQEQSATSLMDDNITKTSQDYEYNNHNTTMMDNIDDLEDTSDWQQVSSETAKEDYQQAWNVLSERLESGSLGTASINSKTYQYIQNNPFLTTLTSSSSENITTSTTFNVDDRINELLIEAKEHYEQGKIKQAILCLEAIVQQADGVNNDEAWSILENDEDKKAIYCLNKSLDCDPYNLQALLALGTSYVNELDSLHALETLRTWIAHNPKFQDFEVIVDEYSDGTILDEIMQLMLRASSYDTTDVDVRVVLGVLYNVSMDYSNAIQCFLQASTMSPNDYSLVNKLAASYANNNQSDFAIPHYAKALQLRPNFARGWLNLGISFANLERFEEAAKAYVQALHLNPNARHIWNYLRVILNSMDRLDLIELTSKENIIELANEFQVNLIQIK